MRVLAPAKINLHLRVGSPRADGFHPVLTWMCAVGLFDILTLDRTQQGGVSLSCDLPELACDASNLVVKAAAAMADFPARAREWSVPPAFGVAVRLQKRIPVGAGLGGGSSDGASTLLALNRLWDAGLSVGDLTVVAGQLGSDVPFFLHGGSAVCRGRGDIVQPMAVPRPPWVLLLLPEFPLPTAEVYRKFDEMKLGLAATIEEPDWQQWSQLPALDLLERLVNDLETPAFAIASELGRLRERCQTTLGRIVRMSGSGCSFFSLFDERGEADVAAQRIAQDIGIRAVVAEIAAQPADDLNSNLMGR